MDLILALILSGLFLQKEAQAPPLPKDLDLPELVRVAETYGIPFPPKDAKPVLAFADCWTCIGSHSTSHDPGYYRPAFLIEELPGKRARVLLGWQVKIVEPWADHGPAVRPYSLENPEPKLLGYVLDGSNMPAFITLVQLARRGDVEDAKKLWAHMSGAVFFREANFNEGTGALMTRPRIFLSRCVYEFLADQTLTGETPLTETYDKLLKLKKEYPELFSDDPNDFYPAQRSRFIRDLGLTSSAQKAPEGSVEGLLVKLGNVSSGYRPPGHSCREEADGDRTVREIYRLGLKAVQELGKLTGDPRLTRQTNHAIMNSPSERLRLGGLASALRAEMCGSRDPGGASGIPDRPEEEGEFFRIAAIEIKGDKISRYYEVPLWILGERYPKSLLALGKEAPEKAGKDCEPFPLCGAIQRSRLSSGEKSAMLVHLADWLKGDRRLHSALQSLAEVDGAKCASFVKSVLSSLPKDVDEPYWTCEAASWTHVVMQLEDDEIWKDYLRAARAAAVGLRMEMMTSMNYAYVGDKNRERRLGFLAAFLNDETVRDATTDPKKYEGPCAASIFPKITVRDFVATLIASLLKLENRSTEFWTADEWAMLRTRVREALAKETIPAWSR